ncbi:Cytochrome f [Capsicum baccatum]|uniref:Cytochrome f n=1 Tax=Capsicum baccatum TaxID=33114 RepID=A0A2G2VNF7_CAPBA|nr:Cytochrome f [Capsicum baccatum]
MSSSDRIELLVDPGTWDPMDEDMVSLDAIEFHSEEDPYKDRIDSYQRKTGLIEDVQTGIGQINGILVAIGVMDFQFMGQGYENPRDATRRIVCANCYLANKTMEIEVPQAVHPNTVFEAVVRIPYDMQLKQVLANGGNRGRGQIYPDGSKSNNMVYNATATGIVRKIIRKEKGGYEITITDASEGRQVVDIIPPRQELLVSEAESIKFDQPLTSNPNVGGFGQGDTEIVLQDPLRVQGLFSFVGSIILAQIFLVLKKKQFEKVQLDEMNF